MVFEALIVFCATIVPSAILVALIIRLSHHKSWYDQINERKIHSGDVPRLGGIGFALVFIIAATIIVFLTQKVDSAIRFLPCLAGMFIIVISGVWDDFYPMKPHNKLLMQILSGLCVVIPGFTFGRIIYFDGEILNNIPLLSYSVTLLWIVGLTNALNLIDGVDGLAGGVSAIIALTLGLIFFRSTENLSAALLCICLFGSVIGFLIFNVPIPSAKIFMGDGGSQFLGFTLAILSLLEDQKTNTNLPVLYAAALLIIPIFDTTAAVWRRVRDRKRIDTPDKAHIHHKLMNLGLSPQKVNVILLSLQLLISALVFISLHIQGWLSLGILGIVYLLAIVFFAILHFLNRKAVLSAGEEMHPSGNNTPPLPPYRCKIANEFQTDR